MIFDFKVISTLVLIWAITLFTTGAFEYPSYEAIGHFMTGIVILLIGLYIWVSSKKVIILYRS